MGERKRDAVARKLTEEPKEEEEMSPTNYSFSCCNNQFSSTPNPLQH
jgi:hypothetical protein